MAFSDSRNWQARQENNRMNHNDNKRNDTCTIGTNNQEKKKEKKPKSKGMRADSERENDCNEAEMSSVSGNGQNEEVASAVRALGRSQVETFAQTMTKSRENKACFLVVLIIISILFSILLFGFWNHQEKQCKIAGETEVKIQKYKTAIEESNAATQQLKLKNENEECKLELANAIQLRELETAEKLKLADKSSEQTRELRELETTEKIKLLDKISVQTGESISDWVARYTSFERTRDRQLEEYSSCEMLRLAAKNEPGECKVLQEAYFQQEERLTILTNGYLHIFTQRCESALHILDPEQDEFTQM